MLRLLFTFCLMVVAARWIYSEVQLSFPSAVPVIDYTLAKLTIPTHDQWPKGEIKAAFERVAESVTSQVPDRNSPDKKKGLHKERAAVEAF